MFQDATSSQMDIKVMFHYRDMCAFAKVGEDEKTIGTK